MNTFGWVIRSILWKGIFEMACHCVYLLVVAAIITDSYPLKYFWVAVRGYLVLSSGKILFPTPILYTYTPLYPQDVFGHIDRFLTLFLPQLFELGTPLGDWNSPAVDQKLFFHSYTNSLATPPFREAPCCGTDSPARWMLDVRHQEVLISAPEVVQHQELAGQCPELPHCVVLRLEVLTVYYFSFLSVTVLILQERVNVSWISD